MSISCTSSHVRRGLASNINATASHKEEERERGRERISFRVFMVERNESEWKYLLIPATSAVGASRLRNANEIPPTSLDERETYSLFNFSLKSIS
jgi:hypothetical protein